MTAVYIIVGGVLGLLLASVIGVLYVVAVGGVEEGERGQYIVVALQMAGIITGMVAGWRLA
jgi:hypothetical protein